MERLNQIEAGLGNTSIKIVLDEIAFAGSEEIMPLADIPLVGVKETYGSRFGAESKEIPGEKIE